MIYSEKIQKIENELYRLLSNTLQSIWDLPLKYKDLKPDIAISKINDERYKVESKFNKDVQEFIKAKTEINGNMISDIRKKLFPLIRSVYTERNGGFVEYNNALLFVSNLPSNFERHLRAAFSDDRKDFVFSVIELASTDKNTDPKVKMKMEELLKEFKLNVGINETEEEPEQLMEVIDTAKGMLNTNFLPDKPLWDSVNSKHLEKISVLNRTLYDNLKSVKYPHTQY